MKLKHLNLAYTLLSTQYALMLEYRAEIFLWAISGILPLIMYGIWSEAGVSIGLGIDSKWLFSYFVSAFIVRQFTAVWVMVSFEEDNLEGRLSPYLLQPIYPFWRYFSSHVAEQITRLPFVLLILTIIFIFNNQLFWFPSPFKVFLSIIAIFIAFTVRFLLHWIFAMICFWNDRASAIERLLLLPYLFLSGLVAPLDTFPEPIKNIALLTPFPYVLSFPAKLLAGHNVDIFNGFLNLILWAFVFFIIGFWAWKKGVRHYSGMGA